MRDLPPAPIDPHRPAAGVRPDGADHPAADRLDAAALEGLARRLLDPELAAEVADPGEPVLVLVTPTEEDLALALRPAGGDPAVALRGLRAPAGCRAAGVIASAHLRPMPTDLDLDAPWPTTATDAPRHPARIAVLVDAGDRVACARTGADLDGVARSWTTAPGEERHGRLLDALRCVLGLPTAPPPADTGALWTALWLQRLVDDPPTSWPEARRRHAAAAVLPELAGGADADDGALVEAAGALSGLWPWEGLRRALARGDHDLVGISPTDADWFDEGAFARAVLEGLVEPGAALRALERRVPPTVHHHVAGVVGAALTDLVGVDHGPARTGG